MSEELAKHVQQAHDIIDAIDKGERRWSMSIPAQPEYDADLVISRALTEQAQRIAALEAQVAEAQRERDAARDSRKRLVNLLYEVDEIVPPATRWYSNLKLRTILLSEQLGFRLSMAEAQLATAKDRAETAEAALTAARQREQGLREALSPLFNLEDEHLKRYQERDNNEYWRGRRDEAGYLTDKLRAALTATEPQTKKENDNGVQRN